MTKHLLHSADPIAVGKRLAEARSALDLTQQQAADAIGLTSSSIAEIEDGVRLPRPAELVKLAEYYRKPVIEFIDDGYQLIPGDGRGLTHQLIEAAVLAYLAGDLTEAELARRLRIDIVSMREFIQKAGVGSPWDSEPLKQLQQEQQARIKILWDFAAGFADLTPDQIEQESSRALAEVRAEQRTGSPE